MRANGTYGSRVAFVHVCVRACVCVTCMCVCARARSACVPVCARRYRGVTASGIAAGSGRQCVGKGATQRVVVTWWHRLLVESNRCESKVTGSGRQANGAAALLLCANCIGKCCLAANWRNDISSCDIAVHYQIIMLSDFARNGSANFGVRRR